MIKIYRKRLSLISLLSFVYLFAFAINGSTPSESFSPLCSVDEDNIVSNSDSTDYLGKDKKATSKSTSYSIFSNYKPALGGVPESMDYSQIYSFIDELAQMHVIEIGSVVKPYGRNQIASWLVEAKNAYDVNPQILSKRQAKELAFFLNDFSLERDTIPNGIVNWTNHRTFSLALLQPAFHYNDKNFACKINPIIGADITANKKGAILHRWWGAEIRADIVNHISVWGSIRDHSFFGDWLSKEYYPGGSGAAALLSLPNYLNNLPGAEYHRSKYGGDYAEVNAGIKAYTKWGSVAFLKDKISWGDTYHSSNIISNHAPSFPMVELKIHPCSWFKLDYIHGWLVSNIIDSTNYYSQTNPVDGKKEILYRPAKKYIAANMLTFTPIKYLDLSIGSSVIYGGKNPLAAFSLPISFFNSIDYQINAGAKVENENSQIFFNISTRNLKYTHFYVSFYCDEFKFSRVKKSNPEHNFFSYKVGAQLSGWPLKDINLTAEFTRTNVANYQHPYNILSYRSNDYLLGHYLGDNAQEIYIRLGYKPVRSLNLMVEYIGATKYNQYIYSRSSSIFMTKKPFAEKIWSNDEVKFTAIYEVVNNAYATFEFAWNNAQGYTPSSDPIVEEVRLNAQGYLNRFTPSFLQGKNLTAKIGFSFYF